MKITKKAYIDNQLQWLEKVSQERIIAERRVSEAELKAVRQAVDKLETTNESAVSKLEKTSSDYRLSQNEWRGQLKDQAGTFVTKRELWLAVTALIGIVFSILMYLK